MREAAAEALNVDVTTSMVAIVTVITVLVFGLVTLARPSRATVTWAAAFALGMLGTYLWVGAHNGDQPALRAAASGLLIGFEPLIWLGLRLHRGRPARWWPVVLFVVCAPVLLAATSSSPAFQITFRAVFLLGGIFAALIVVELLRSRQAPRDVTMPLLLASSGFVVIAVAGAFSALLGGATNPAAQLGLLRGVNAVGTIVTCACAAFTIALMVRGDAGAGAGAAGEGAVHRRLRRVQTLQEGAWSLLDVRLDDPADLREAFTGSVFTRIVGRLRDDVDATLPAAADIDHLEDGRTLVLLEGSEEAVEHHVRTLLARISEVHPEVPGEGVRVSASVGWASTAVCGYEEEALRASAAAAAIEARASGGDRWARGGAVAEPAPGVPSSARMSPAPPTTLER